MSKTILETEIAAVDTTEAPKPFIVQDAHNQSRWTALGLMNMPAQRKSIILLLSLILANPSAFGGDWVATSQQDSLSECKALSASSLSNRAVSQKNSAMPQSPLTCGPLLEPSNSAKTGRYSGASKASSGPSVSQNHQDEQPLKQSQIQKVSSESTNDSHIKAASFAQQQLVEAASDFRKPICETFDAKVMPFAGTAGSVQSSFNNESKPNATAGPVHLQQDQVLENATNATYMEELKGLIKGQHGESIGTSSYLTELNQLLGRQADWILARGSLVDLAPGAPSVEVTTESYLDDLRRLSPVGRAQFSAMTHRSIPTGLVHRSPYRQIENDGARTVEYYEIPAESRCASTGGKSATGLFQPLTYIKVNGVSTDPPKPPKNVKTPELKLTRPSNDACAYLSDEIPGHYFTSGYGVRKSPRNTLKFCHNPLYFEDPNQERCGQSKGCLTSACSAIHFTTMAVLLPYQKTVDPPNSCVAALPDCPTCSSFASDAYFPEWSWKAAAVQTAAVTGLVFIIP